MAAVSPLVGLAGEESALPMAIVMLVAGLIALLSLVALTRAALTSPDPDGLERRLESVARR